MDRIIYALHQGKMTKINNPSQPERANFVILFGGKDWSGFRTLKECEDQFPTFEKHRAAELFTVVER